MTEAGLVVPVTELHVQGEASRSRVSVRPKRGTARLARTDTRGLAEPSRFLPTTRQSPKSRDYSMTGWTNGTVSPLPNVPDRKSELPTTV